MWNKLEIEFDGTKLAANAVSFNTRKEKPLYGNRLHFENLYSMSILFINYLARYISFIVKRNINSINVKYKRTDALSLWHQQ